MAVLPEACLNDKLLAAWRQALVSIIPPIHSRLTWLVVGTGPVGGDEPPYNRAVVIDRRGQDLWTQDKQFDFSLSEPGQGVSAPPIR